MLFNSFSYAVFLPIVVTLYWASPARARRLLLLFASYLFYMSWLPQYGLLIAAMTGSNFLFGRWLATARRKRAVLALAVAANLATLALFKYAGFLQGSLDSLLAPLGWSVRMGWVERIILPLGISFFTFEFIHYLVDLYRGGKPIRSFVDFALFPAFFPTQIAGPIKRYQNFVPQLDALPLWNGVSFQQGLALIVRGLFKKVVLADNLAVTANMGFDNFQRLGTVDAWFSVLAFAFQIYFDFSGYTDIGRGSAQLLGLSVPENFHLPYLAGNIAEFWRRWHVTLSQWLRDYLFIPLGGSRGSRLLTYRNLLITMTLGGLWHGANWTFVIWGLYHGLMLVLHREQSRLTAGWQSLAALRRSRLGQALAVVGTFVVVCIGWVLFRARSVAQAVEILQRMAAIDAPWLGTALNETLILEVTLILAGYAAVIWGTRSLGRLRAWPGRMPNLGFVRAAYYAALIIGIAILPPQVSQSFIYFQF